MSLLEETDYFDNVKDMWVGRELIDDLSSGSMPDLYTAVGGECGAADLQ